MYTVDYFIKKFEAIPENLWCVNTREKNGARCALGWCYETPEAAIASEKMSHKEDSAEDQALCHLISTHFKTMMPAGINNGIYPDYQQPTPKQRILAALYDIKNAQPRVSAIPELLKAPVEERVDHRQPVKILTDVPK